MQKNDMTLAMKSERRKAVQTLKIKDKRKIRSEAVRGEVKGR